MITGYKANISAIDCIKNFINIAVNVVIITKS